MTMVFYLQLVAQCEDEELMDIVLPRLTKVLSLWELLLAKVHANKTHANITPIHSKVFDTCLSPAQTQDVSCVVLEFVSVLL